MMGTEPNTLNKLFNSAVDRYRDSDLVRFKVDGDWRSLTFGDVARRVRELALGLKSLGINSGDRIAIWSENRPEWNLADLAALAIGAVDVPLYRRSERRNADAQESDGERVEFLSMASPGRQARACPDLLAVHPYI